MTPARTIRRITLAWLISATLAATATAAPYEVTVIKDVMVPMRDGIRLATDIYLPMQDGKPIDGEMPPVDISDQYGLDLGED